MEVKNDISNKLLRVERTINIYNKNDELLKEEDINLSTDLLKEIVIPNDDDPLLYDGYDLNIVQLEKLNSLLQKKILINTNLYSYVLVAGGIYNW